MKLAVLPNLTKKNAREIALSVLREGKALGIQCVMCDSLKADFIQGIFLFSQSRRRCNPPILWFLLAETAL